MIGFKFVGFLACFLVAFPFIFLSIFPGEAVLQKIEG